VQLRRIHHVAVICSDYERAKRFYAGTLGLAIVGEHRQPERGSTKLDLELPDGGRIELFHLPGAPARLSYPEALGLRHLAFAVDDVEASRADLIEAGVEVQEVRIDPYTGRRFAFLHDPDDLPIELYEL
jgi:glyoxylase I family protein